MSADLPSLLIVANSGRAMAESAVRGGFSVTVFDGFCDQETQVAACCRPLSFNADGFDSEQLLTEMEFLGSGAPFGLVYGAGFEATPSLLTRLPENYRLLGNEPAVLELLRHPLAYIEMLDELEVPYPEVRFTPPKETNGKVWLVKRAGSSGGQGVTYWREEWTGTDAEYYFQRFMQGSAMSALFIADGQTYRTIGYNSLKFSSAIKTTPFLYLGAVGQMSLDATLRQQVEQIIEKLVYRLNLRGVNSLDFILSDGKIYVLDLNSRPTATLELYEHQLTDGWMKRHIQACLGNLPGPLRPDPAAGVYGHLIVYAPQAMQIPATLDWPHWTRDRPVPGLRIALGEPVCSVFAQGRTPAEVEASLQQYHSGILAMIPSLSNGRIEASK